MNRTLVDLNCIKRVKHSFWNLVMHWLQNDKLSLHSAAPKCAFLAFLLYKKDFKGTLSIFFVEMCLIFIFTDFVLYKGEFSKHHRQKNSTLNNLKRCSQYNIKNFEWLTKTLTFCCPNNDFGAVSKLLSECQTYCYAKWL